MTELVINYVDVFLSYPELIQFINLVVFIPFVFHPFLMLNTSIFLFHLINLFILSMFLDLNSTLGDMVCHRKSYKCLSNVMKLYEKLCHVSLEIIRWFSWSIICIMITVIWTMVSQFFLLFGRRSRYIKWPATPGQILFGIFGPIYVSLLPVMRFIVIGYLLRALSNIEKEVSYCY